MKIRRGLKAALTTVLCTIVACAPARGLVTLNDSHDHVFVTGSMGISRDSNVFANRDSAGDFVYSSSVAAEYTRRAGWIGVNAGVVINASRYGTIRGEDFSNPSYSLELTKQSGRTTGSFTLNGARESRADSAVNVRSSSWNYAAGLNYKYPIIERFTLSGSFGYSARKYIDEAQFANLSTYTASTDLFYVFTNERDLVAGYRFRQGETSRNTSTTDHSITGGITGRIIRGINGAVRVGYQVRTPHGGNGDRPEYHSVTASGSASYSVNRKIKINGSLARDFATTATDASVQTTTANIEATYDYSNHWTFSAGAGWGDSQFLGEKGRIIIRNDPPVVFGPNRHDNYANANASIGYSLNEHFKASFTYTWFKNWSAVEFADFVRNGWGLNFSSRW